MENKRLDRITNNKHTPFVNYPLSMLNYKNE